MVGVLRKQPDTYLSYFIGLLDAEREGTWEWVTGEAVTFTNWSGGEPNNSGDEDGCELAWHGTWNDRGLGDKAYGCVIEIE
jgi:hypothetical protein